MRSPATSAAATSRCRSSGWPRSPPAPPVRIGLSATQKPIEDVARFLVGGRRRRRALRHRRHRPHARARPRPRGAVVAARSGDVARGVGAGLRAARRSRGVASHHARVRQHAAHGRARGAPPVGPPRRGRSDVASRQHGQGAAARGRAAPEARRAQGAGGHGVARARHRHRRRRPRLPARLAALDRHVPAACRTREPPGRAACRRRGSSRCRATISSNAPRCSMPSRAASSTALRIPVAPLDVLAQQIVAEVAARELAPRRRSSNWCRARIPYRELDRDVVRRDRAALSEGFRTSRGQRGAYVHRDAVNGVLRARGRAPHRADVGRRDPRHRRLRRGARACRPRRSAPSTRTSPSRASPATSSSSATRRIASVASRPGACASRTRRDRRRRFRSGSARRRVARDELSRAVSRLRDDVAARARSRREPLARIAESSAGVASAAPASQLVDYLRSAHAVLGALPTHDTVVLERFFDETGGMQLVDPRAVRQPHQPRVGPRAAQALLRQVRLRAAGGRHRGRDRAVAVDEPQLRARRRGALPALDHGARGARAGDADRADVRRRAGAGSPASRSRCRAFAAARRWRRRLQRMRAEDLMASVFPDQVACAENLVGEREVPDHPLVRQTIHDCLHEAMDVDGLEAVLRGIEIGRDRVSWRATCPRPRRSRSRSSTARPYAYLDDAPLEERRTQAVMARRWLDRASAADLGRLDADARSSACATRRGPQPQQRRRAARRAAGPGVRSRARKWQALPGAQAFVDTLVAARRATRLRAAAGGAARPGRRGAAAAARRSASGRDARPPRSTRPPSSSPA